MDPLKKLFEWLVEESHLKTLVEENREEDLHLEFKQKQDRRSGDLGPDDRRGFSKAVSGFANADGGVVLFGIETAKTVDGVDRAAGLKPITDHQRFRARLMDSILNTTQPVVDGIRIEPIGAGQAGYVKVLIPQSFNVPHRAIHAEHQYWRRLSTGHRRMEHYELEDVFGRRLRPSLELLLELRLRPDPDEHEELHFYLLNEGRGVGKHCGLLCKFRDAAIAYTEGLSDQSRVNGGTPTVVFYDDRAVIHPNGISRAVGHVVIKRAQKATPFPVAVTWYAENMDTRRANVTVTPGPAERVPR